MHRSPFLWAQLILFSLLASAATDPNDSLDFTLHLGDLSFDPVVDEPRPAPPWGVPASGPASDFYLVQLAGPVEAAWRTYLEQNHLKVIQYLHPYTYVVWGEPSRLSQLDEGFIRWTGPFLPAYRVLPAYRKAAGPAENVSLLVYRGADLDKIREALRQNRALLPRWVVIDSQFYHVTCQLAPSHFAALAAVPGVYSIQSQPTDGGNRDEMQAQLIANQIVSNAAVPGYPTYLNTVGLSGEGVIIASVDSGIDQTHPDLVGKFVPCDGLTCDEARSSNHGTHVAGIAAGGGFSATRFSGFLRGLGVAPGADLLEQYYPDVYLTPGGIQQLVKDSYRNGARLSSNSWGTARTARGYDVATRELDVAVRDADPEEIGNQSFTYVIAIENGSGGTSEQGAPEEAKNAIRVGSTYLRTEGGVARSDYNSISDNSAHGPALDGRTLPDIVAPGKYVDSTVPGTGYLFLGGTSMAAPAVAGSAALFFEYFRSLPQNPGGFDPSPALVKAALVSSALDLAGNNDADGGLLGHRSDSKQGWGRLNLDNLINNSVSVAYIDAPQVLDHTGDSWTETLTVGNPLKPVRVFLVYTDAPGHGLGGTQAAWNNNLNLEVDNGGQTYKGNVFNGSGWSTTGGTADGANNIEAVQIGPTSPNANLTVRVNAANLNSDGVPGVGNSTDQDFAIVCENCVQAADFILFSDEPVKALCAGEEKEWTLSIGQQGGFTGSVSLAVSGLPVGVGAIFTFLPITPPETTTLRVINTGILATGDYPFEVVATSGKLSHSIELSFHVDNGLPAQPTLSAPLNGAIDQTASPLFRWQALSGSEVFEYQLATDALFANLIKVKTQVETEYTLTDVLGYSTTYYWRVRAINLCGEGTWSPTFSFQTLAAPPILLVDDDNNLPDVRAQVADVLDYLGIGYDLWDVALHLNTEPDAVTLSQYQAAFWFSGDAFNFAVPLAGPSAAGEASLATYLDGGGCLILSAQHYLLNRGGTPFVPTSFMTNYLGLQSAILNTPDSTVVGVGAGFDQLGPFDLNATYQIRADQVTPDGVTDVNFTYGSTSAALYRHSGVYKSIFLPWPIDAVPDKDRTSTIEALLATCGVFTNLCRNEADFQAKLPFWPEEQPVLELIECLNLFLVP